ncbi:hypothetical protein SRB5_25640 [Streptomyces sp. RB5]|uniref:DUF1697 domain-containing protein n=1 Tax=Streptomyces smaragdinus TaxID=2585196 RepID=A0A7K0CG23_9ACTN|nr:DUF1697 domain-containing protein [Streptomyces smaragdinus]MQY12430.1 hypothetical protein [Streptomyces smaragdinus]
MSKQIALLRGINVSGTNKIPMARLREILTERGYANVVTYVASGNIVFDDPGTAPEKTAMSIELAISEEFGLQIPVIVRTRDEILELIESNPLPDATAEPAKFLAVFLSAVPRDTWFQTDDPEKYEPDQYVVGDRVVYVWCPNGLGRSKLAANFANKKLGFTATARNWNTVLKLRELTEEH